MTSLTRAATYSGETQLTRASLRSRTRTTASKLSNRSKNVKTRLLKSAKLARRSFKATRIRRIFDKLIFAKKHRNSPENY